MWHYFSLLALLLLPLQSQASAIKAQRIISLAPHLTELVYSLGAGDRLVATVEYADYPPAAKDLPRVGNYAQINIEALIALEPDLVLIWQQGVQQDLANKLAEFGILTYSATSHSLAQFSSNVLALGEALGEPQQAQQLQQQIDKSLSLLRPYQNQSKVSVFYQMAAHPLRSISAQSWLNDYLTYCGADNIMATASSPYPTISLEEVLIADPQAILLVQHQSQHQWLKWPQLQAVSNGHIFQANPSHLHRLTLRSLPALNQLCTQIDQVRHASAN